VKKKKLIDKKIEKLKYGKCIFCGEDNLGVLDVHRIVYGSEGGRYTKANTLCACATCHRKIHQEIIVVVGKYSTGVQDVIIYLDENNEEKIIKV